MSQQGLRQASVRTSTGTSLDYNGDWHALFDAAGIAAGDWNGRFLAWVNVKLGTSYADVPGAMAALAAANSATNFSSLGSFDAGLVPPVTEADIIALITNEGALYNISNLSSLFFDRGGAAATTPAVVDGLVGTIKDLGPNARHKVASADTARGTLRFVDGIYYVEMDGIDDEYHTVDLTASQPRPFYFAAAYNRPTGFVSTLCDVELRTAGSTFYAGLRASPNTPTCRNRAGSVAGSTNAPVNSFPDGTWGVADAVATYTQQKIAVNGATYTTAAIALLGTETLTGHLNTASGETGTATNVPLKYAASLHLDYEPDASQREQIITFLTSLFF
jgi:hypothetical protein